MFQIIAQIPEIDWFLSMILLKALAVQQRRFTSSRPRRDLYRVVRALPRGYEYHLLHDLERSTRPADESDFSSTFDLAGLSAGGISIGQDDGGRFSLL
jgi:hypothetical protein